MEVIRLFQFGRNREIPAENSCHTLNFAMAGRAEKPQRFPFDLKELLQLLHRGHETRRFLS